MRKKKRNARCWHLRLLALTITQILHAAVGGRRQGENLEEIVVTGLIGSLQRNLDLKRQSSGVVDVISSEDIGKFPDSNVAASLQRVPGVSIQRSGTRGEPEGITVRGFGGDFNETLYDGRRISTAAGGRSVDFTTVGADFVGSLTVMKTPDVTLSSSSIGATVNVAFPKPFDSPGMRFVASAGASEQEEAGSIQPTGGLLFSDTFADDTIGFLADASTRSGIPTRIGYSFPGGKAASSRPASSRPSAIRGISTTPTRPSSAGGSSSSAPSNHRSRMSASMAASPSSGDRRMTPC
jgi:TonB-dependent receptor